MALSSVVPAQESAVSTLVDPVAALDVTTVEASSAERSVIIREEIVQSAVAPVIATKTVESPERRERLLPSVDTISGAEIRTAQYREVGDILRQSAGLNLVQTGQTGSVNSLFIRGMESNHTVVLLNGRRLPPGLGGQYQLEYLDVATLESVQILRGATSSLYGSDALAGAIDLRSTDARFINEDSLNSFVEAGSFSTFRTGHKLAIRDGRLGLALDTSYVETDNDRPRSRFENGVVRGNVSYEIADGVYIDVLGYIQDSSLEVAGSSLGLAFPEPQINDNQSSLFSPRFSIVRDEWDFSMFYSHTKNELVASRNLWAPSDNRLDQTSHEFEAVFNWHPNKEATYTLGVGHYTYEFERNPFLPGPFNPPSAFGYGYGSIFAQGDLDLPANFHLLASGRYDGHDTFESKATYTVQLDHEIEATGTTLFGKVATGYKAPSGQDFVFLGNPALDPATLQPEESLTREIGVRQALFNKRSSLSLTYFETEVDNLVDGDPFFFDPAVVDIESSGVEVELVVSPTENVSLYANATWLDATIVAGDYSGGWGGVPGDRLPRRPGFALSGGVVLTGERWKAGAEITGAYDRYDAPGVILDDYTVARIFGSYEISDRLEIYGRLENVFDLDYETTRGYEAAGFGAYGGVRYVWGK
ncbi:MAG TPA: TonB-dependent receptor [Bacteroidia bacterium]|nr:TonB-dependent receptor [Bacteroidia bacterium]